MDINYIQGTNLIEINIKSTIRCFLWYDLFYVIVHHIYLFFIILHINFKVIGKVDIEYENCNDWP